MCRQFRGGHVCTPKGSAFLLVYFRGLLNISVLSWGTYVGFAVCDRHVWAQPMVQKQGAGDKQVSSLFIADTDTSDALMVELTQAQMKPNQKE